MMTMLLEWVFTASFLILTVLLLRWVFGRRVSARLRYALWAVVLVRLLVPVQLFTSPLAGTWVLTETRTERIIQAPAAPTAPAGSAMGLPVTTGSVPAFPDAPSLPDAPEPPAAPDLTKAPVWLGWTWLGGSAALALVLAGSNLRFARRLRRGRIPVEDADCPLRVYAAVGLPSPCLFGLVRPAVYVTPEAAADPAMLRHVVAHEYTHFRHGDQIWSFLRCAALAAHWWNPLVWLAGALSRRDGELACDEGALRRLGDGERLAYGNTLLALVTAKPGPVDLLCFATTMAGDKKSLKERVSRIARAPKRWLWAAVAVVLVTALACVCAFGQKAEGRPAAGDSAKLPPADLSFALDYSDDGTPFVRIEGQADGREVKHTVWHPEGDGFGFGSLVDISDEGEKQGPQLSMRYEFPTGGAELAAKWADGEHTSVTLSTAMSASLSSIFNSGYWVFTVELSGDSGTVVFKEHSKGSSNPSVGKLTLYPEALPDEDAIQAARYAAKLLTAAEDWYKNCTAGEDHSEVPQVCTLDEYGSHMQLTYQGKVTDFYGFWDKGIQSDPAPQVLDLNGDGRDEIAFILVTGHGTGALDEQLYLFDAETLERYDTTDDLTGRLLQQIQSTGDGDCFYLSAPGMERVAISKEDVRGENPDVPLADALELGSHNEYSIEGGKLFCRLGCDASGRYMNYLGEVRVALELGRDGAVTASSFAYEQYQQYEEGSSMAVANAFYQNVLLGETNFTLRVLGRDDETGNEEIANIADVPSLLDPDDPYMKLWNFAVVDMDGDGINEVLVYGCGVSGDRSGYLLLHQMDGRVYGLVIDHTAGGKQWFLHLKTDGTYTRQDRLGTDWMCIERLGFRTHCYILDGLAYAGSSDHGEYDFFLVNHQEATQAEFEAVRAAQDAKPDAEWYDFTEESINVVFRS